MSFKNQTELIGGVNKIIENLNTRRSKGNLKKLKKLEKMDFKFLDQTGGKIMKETLHMLHGNYDNRNENKPNILRKNYISSIKKQALKGGGVTKNGDFTLEMKAVLDMVGGGGTDIDTDTDSEDDLVKLHDEMVTAKEGADACAEIERGSGYTNALQEFIDIDTVPDTASENTGDNPNFHKLLKFNEAFHEAESTNIITSLIRACDDLSGQIKDCETNKKAHDDLAKKVKSVAKKQEKAAVDAHANAAKQLEDANESHDNALRNAEEASRAAEAAEAAHKKLEDHVANLEDASPQQKEKEAAKIAASREALAATKEVHQKAVAHTVTTLAATTTARTAEGAATDYKVAARELNKKLKNGDTIGSGIEKAKDAANIAENAMTEAATAKEAATATAAKQKEAAAKQKAVAAAAAKQKAVNTAANDS